MPKRVAEFFAGIGLMRLGLEAEGWKVIWANDLDAGKCAMYRHHFGRQAEEELVREDVHLLSAQDFPDVELATASFPCNDLSLAGGRNGLAGAHSSAFWGFIRLLRELGPRRPPLVLLENVAGFLTSRGGGDFLQALRALNELGYRVDAFQIDASHFVPQSRQRLFVLGAAGSFPKQTAAARDAVLRESPARPPALRDFISGHPEVLWNVRKLPPFPVRRISLREVLEDIPANSPLWWSAERRDYLLSQMSPKHRVQAQDMIDHPGGWTCGTVFRRVRKGQCMAELRSDGVAGCLRTPRGGSGRQILLQAGQGGCRVRLLTPRECARLMGAPDFQIAAAASQALFGFGDAVCVPVIQWIARHALNPAREELQGASAFPASEPGPGRAKRKKAPPSR